MFLKRLQSNLAYAFDKVNYTNHSIKHTGLFGYNELDRPKGLELAAKKCVEHASLLVQQVINAESDEEVSKTVKRVDTISDILCSVLDSAELIRHVHPQSEFVEAANKTSSMLHTYLNQLNTNRSLYLALKKVFERPAVEKRLGHHERKVAKLLLQDFEKSGVHMPLKTRKKIIELNDSILQLGQKFSMNSYPFQESIVFKDPRKSLLGAAPKLIDALIYNSNSENYVEIPIHSEISSLLLRTVRSETSRRELFLAMNSAGKDQIAVLEEMLSKRAQLAEMLGNKSYGQMYLADKMVSSPGILFTHIENVLGFLESLSKTKMPAATAELEQLQHFKKMDSSSNTIRPWDKYYYAQFIQNTKPKLSKQYLPLSSYFSVGNVFNGLSDIFYALYRVRLVVQDIIPGEVWHSEVRKLSVVHETEGVIGTIYCDLFQREAEDQRKYDNAAHFTIRCCRRIDNDEPERQTNIINSMHERVLDTPQGKKRYQIPIVVLVTSFSRPQNDIPGLLDLTDIETLFHEMGHAMHSMLSQTDYQHISGTRVAMDFVEVPSILMEYFGKLPELLGKIGRHYKTSDPIPMELLLYRQSSQELLQGLEMQNQIQMAILDQEYHSSKALSADFDSSKIMYDLSSKVNLIPISHPMQYQVQFSHLFTYGSSYYSYLWCRKWASKIFNKYFMNKKVDEWNIGGHLLRHEILGTGGGRDPWVGLEKMGIINE